MCASTCVYTEVCLCVPVTLPVCVHPPLHSHTFTPLLPPAQQPMPAGRGLAPGPRWALPARGKNKVPVQAQK